MFISKKSKGLERIASREATRYALNGIHVEPGHLTASDGKMLFTIELDEATMKDLAENGAQDMVRDFKPFNISIEDFKRVFALLQKGGVREAFAFLKRVKDGETGTATFGYTGSNGDKTPYELSVPISREHEYPDWRKIFPKEKDAQATIMVDPGLLAKASTQIQQFTSKHAPAARLRVYKDKVTLESVDENGRKARLVLMGMAVAADARLDEQRKEGEASKETPEPASAETTEARKKKNAA